MVEATGLHCYDIRENDIGVMFMLILSGAMSNGFPIHTILLMLFMIAIRWVPLMILFVLLVKALLKYLRNDSARKENAATLKSLGEVLKEHRTNCKMTQEFVAEHLGVSRQAVSKWENGTSDPSTSNLLALAKLYEISVEDLLKEVQ